MVTKGENGFTLIELIIAIAIAALITGGITFAVMQVLTINTRASNHMVAVRQVQQAGKEVSKDTLQAQSVNATGSGWGFTLNLEWDEWGTNQTHTVNYTLVNGPGGVVGLQRSHSVNGNSTVTTVAEYIDLAGTSCCCDCDGDGECDGDCNCDDRVVIFTVTATLGTESETRIYEVEPRPE
ncbi:MAG: prepilin-type N-terminal cleavage/methylation domain-containing protein [Dehalococcoidia bacterium]